MRTLVGNSKSPFRMENWLADTSLQRKITLLVVLVTLIAVSLTYVAFMVYDSRVAKGQLVTRATTLAELIGDNCVASLSFLDPEDATRTLNSLDAEKDIEEAVLWDARDVVFAAYQRQLGGRVPPLTSDGHAFTERHLTVTRAVLMNGEAVGHILIRTNLNQLASRQRQYVTTALLLLLVALVIATALAAKYQVIISKPIVSLADLARRVSDKKDYSLRAEKRGKDEVGYLIDSFNAMLSEIQRRDTDLVGAQTALKERAFELQQELVERQRAELVAATMKSYLQNVIDSMPSALIAVNSAECVTQWNLQAERITGVTRNQALERPVNEVFPMLENAAALIQTAIVTNEVQKLERVRTNLGDDARVRDIIIYPLITATVQGAVIRVDDVTDRTRMEELMTQTEKMMSVGGLAAGMAHEINNPLGIILQSAQNIKRRVSSDVPKNLEVAQRINVSLDELAGYMRERGIFEFLQDIDEAGKRAAIIVSNMLNFSRKSDSDRSSTKIEDLLDTAVQLAANDYDLKKKFDFRRIRIERDYGPDIPPVPCITTKLEQVFLNLLKNAAHALADFHTGDQPQIVLRTRALKRDVRIEIEDNGPGIPAEIRRRVFEPFFTTKEVGTGTGLGLSVSYFIIVDNHRGTLEVESEPEQGAKFIITLPVDSE